MEDRLAAAGTDPTIATELAGLPGVASIERASDVHDHLVVLEPRVSRRLCDELEHALGLVRRKLGDLPKGVDVTLREDEQMDRRLRIDVLESQDPIDPAAVADFDVRVWVDGPGQPETRVPAVIRDKVRMMDAPQYAPGHVTGRPISLTPPAAARLADLRCPVLAVAGALDVSDIAQIARHLEANAPDARAVILPGVAHMIGMEIPDDLAALIAEFLAPLPRWS